MCWPKMLGEPFVYSIRASRRALGSCFNDSLISSCSHRKVFELCHIHWQEVSWTHVIAVGKNRIDLQWWPLDLASMVTWWLTFFLHTSSFKELWHDGIFFNVHQRISRCKILVVGLINFSYAPISLILVWRNLCMRKDFFPVLSIWLLPQVKQCKKYILGANKLMNIFARIII